MKNLSIIIPCYNEENRLENTFRQLSQGIPSCGLKLKEVILVNDGSTDKTLKVLKDNKAFLEKKLKVKVKIVTYGKNRGKGYAVKQGMLEARGDYCLLTDADFSMSLLELAKFSPLIKKNTDVVIGTRKNGESTVVVPQPIYRQLFGRGFTIVSNIILNTWVTDFTCGFKLFSKDAKNKIFPLSKIERWGYDSEILFLAKKFGFDIQEKALFWKHDESTKVSVIRDIYSSLSELVKIRYYEYKGCYGDLEKLKKPALVRNVIHEQ